MAKVIIAVDPGAQGGIAVRLVRPDGSIRTSCLPMPATRGECIAVIRDAVEAAGAVEDTVMYHENPSTVIPGGGAAMMCEYGKAIERCGCIAETLGVRVIYTTAQRWQKAIGLGKSERVKVPKKGEAPDEEIKSAKKHNTAAKKDWKNKLKGEALRRYPQLKVTLLTADALLILDYGVSQEKGGTGE